MQEKEFMKFYLTKELENLPGEDKQHLQIMLALIGLQSLKRNKLNSLSEIDL